jgi:hypothetical protein
MTLPCREELPAGDRCEWGANIVMRNDRVTLLARNCYPCSSVPAYQSLLLAQSPAAG